MGVFWTDPVGTVMAKRQARRLGVAFQSQHNRLRPLILAEAHLVHRGGLLDSLQFLLEHSTLLGEGKARHGSKRQYGGKGFELF